MSGRILFLGNMVNVNIYDIIFPNILIAIRLEFERSGSEGKFPDISLDHFVTAKTNILQVHLSLLNYGA